MRCIHLWAQSGPNSETCTTCQATCKRDRKTGQIVEYLTADVVADLQHDMPQPRHDGTRVGR